MSFFWTSFSVWRCVYVKSLESMMPSCLVSVSKQCDFVFLISEFYDNLAVYTSMSTPIVLRWSPTGLRII